MRYVILNTVDWAACREVSGGRVPEHEAMRRLSGCAWLFRVEAHVDDAEEAARDAVRDFFRSEAGSRARRSEGEDPMTWERAMSWIPDETWARYGLAAIRHPDVERVVLDGSEVLDAGEDRV